MARLAEYMSELARLFGNADKVHFVKLKRGSAVLETSVEAVAAPKVRTRLSQTGAPAANDEASTAFHKIDLMLANDNAVGKLQRGKALVLRFPGRTSPRIKVGSITQLSTIQGTLVRIGGRDKTSHGLIEDVMAKSWRIVMTRQEAKALAKLIYGPILRICGPARWTRNETGGWDLEELRVQSWEELGEESLQQGIQQLRDIPNVEWREDPDPLGFLNQVRSGEREIH